MIHNFWRLHSTYSYHKILAVFPTLYRISLVELFLWLAFHCCCSNHTCRPASEDPAPLPAWLLKCLCSAHQEKIWPCPPAKRRLTHPLSYSWPFIPWRFARLMALLLYFPTTSPSLFCPLCSVFSLYFLTPSLSGSTKEPGVQTPEKDGYFETLICHLFSLLAFHI